MMIITLFAGLLVVVLVGFPIILAIGATGLVGIMLVPALAPALFPQKMFAMMDSFSLLALPYFILAGAMMSEGGLSRILVNFAQTLVGHIRGSLGHTVVVSCTAMANVSGSSAAEAAAIGQVMAPAMARAGYKPGLSASIIATSATIGPIIPPSMTMIVYGAMTGVSVGGLFIAGVLPGLAMAAALMTVIFAMSFLPGFPELRVTMPRATVREIVRATGRAWAALLAPVIILGGIFSGIFTATEAGIVAVVYSFLASYFFYRTLKFTDLPAIFLDAAITTTLVVGIIAVAGSMSYLLAYLDFNRTMLNFIRMVSDNGTIVLLTLLAIMFLLCMFLESLAVLIILVPVISYVGNAFAIDPLQLGVIMVMSTQIGATTPPVAVLLFIGTSVCKTTYSESVKYCWPFVFTLVAVMLMLVFVPPLATFLPRLAGLGQ